jgi:hypothetical protein
LELCRHLSSYSTRITARGLAAAALCGLLCLLMRLLLLLLVVVAQRDTQVLQGNLPVPWAQDHVGVVLQQQQQQDSLSGGRSASIHGCERHQYNSQHVACKHGTALQWKRARKEKLHAQNVWLCTP